MAETVLVVEDEASQRLGICQFLRQHLKLNVLEAENGQRALDIILGNAIPKPDTVILDLNMPGIHGLDVLKAVRPIKPDLPILVLTACDKVDTVVECMRAGATDYMVKPFSRERLRVTLQNALKIRRLGEEVERKTLAREGQIGFQDLVGHSLNFTKTLQQGEQAAQNRNHLLLEGESGVGKELFARAIHGSSENASLPFVTLNARMIQPAAMDQALFGAAAGKFTGGKLNYLGKCREAGRGTLFINDIAFLPTDVQAKLLRGIQEKRLTGTDGESYAFEARIIATNTSPLEKLVEQGSFRSDLYHAISHNHITLPPLRERERDVLQLAESFVRLYSALENRDIAGLSDDARQKIQEYSWPGNIRELEKTVHRAVAFSTEAQLTAEDLRLFTNQKRTVANDHGKHRTTANTWISMLDEKGGFLTLEQIEEEIMRRAVEISNGCISDAAKMLNIGRSTFYRRLPGQNSGTSA